jgi:hypothetical protein
MGQPQLPDHRGGTGVNTCPLNSVQVEYIESGTFVGSEEDVFNAGIETYNICHVLTDVPFKEALAAHQTIADLHKLIAQWQKAAETYLKQHPIPPGSRPTEITQEQQSSANSAGAFRVCAHELKNILTKHTRP